MKRIIAFILFSIMTVQAVAPIAMSFCEDVVTCHDSDHCKQKESKAVKEFIATTSTASIVPNCRPLFFLHAETELSDAFCTDHTPPPDAC